MVDSPGGCAHLLEIHCRGRSRPEIQAISFQATEEICFVPFLTSSFLTGLQIFTSHRAQWIVAFSAIFYLAFSSPVHADERHMQRAMELVDMLGLEELYTQEKQGVEQNLQQRMETAGLQIPDEFGELVDDFLVELANITEGSFDWPRDKEAIAAMYADHYTDRELRDVMTFQEKRIEWEAEREKFENSDVGIKYAESAGRLRQEYEVITARRIAELQVRFNQALTQIRAREAELAASTDE